MAQSVTSTDIEDVLSSIRRLVLDGASHSASEAEGAERPPAPADPAGGPLVLTPALRVGEATAEAAEAQRPPPLLLVAPVAGGRPAADSPADGGAGAALAGDGPSVPPDEARLRALVTDVVRRELEGPLGERITRNLRKIVRREVLAALADHRGAGTGPAR